MIVTENVLILDSEFIRTYSDRDVYIQGGEPEGLYAEAIDPPGTNRRYIETDIPIPEEKEDLN